MGFVMFHRLLTFNWLNLILSNDPSFHMSISNSPGGSLFPCFNFSFSLQTFWEVLTTIIQVQVKLGHAGSKWSPSYFFTFPPCKHIYISCLHRNVQINVSARKSKFQTKDIKVCWDSHIHNIQLPMFSLNNTLMFWSFDFPFEIERIFKSFAFWPPWKMGEHRPNCRHNHFLAIYFYPMLAHISSAGK